MESSHACKCQFKIELYCIPNPQGNLSAQLHMGLTKFLKNRKKSVWHDHLIIIHGNPSKGSWFLNLLFRIFRSDMILIQIIVGVYFEMELYKIWYYVEELCKYLARNTQTDISSVILQW